MQSRATVLAFTMALAPALAAAQSPSPMAMIEAWEHHHRHILAVIDAAPDTMLAFRTTPGVRTFAEQIDHVGNVAARITAGAVLGRELPAGLLPDPAGYLGDKAKLRAQTDRVFRYVLEALASLGDAELLEERRVFGGSMTRFRWNLTALQHSAWTLGQTVPYLRMNGIAPPQFTPF
ncbi:MAG: DinB family protein [Gemmatimonadales bacterium]